MNVLTNEEKIFKMMLKQKNKTKYWLSFYVPDIKEITHAYTQIADKTKTKKTLCI